jgi:hypothetical protein
MQFDVADQGNRLARFFCENQFDMMPTTFNLDRLARRTAGKETGLRPQEISPALADKVL